MMKHPGRNMSVLLLLLLTVSSTFGSNCKHKLDVVAVLDGSGSIGASDFIKLKNAVMRLAQDLNLGSNGQRFGAIVFSSGVSTKIPLSTNLQSIRSKISSIRQPGGGTATHLGIQSMKQMFQSYGRRGTKQVGIVITDGRSNSEAATISAARAAKNAGITMISVGVGSTSKLNMKELRAIASTSSNVVHLANFDSLKTKFDALVRKICIVHGQWSSWTISRGSCSKTCDGGIRSVTKTRTCTNPRPSGGGRQCSGSSRQTYTERCNTNICIVHGNWSNWTTRSRGSCSKTCDGGTRSVTKTRTCTNPRPRGGGRQCSGSQTKTYTERCNPRICIVPGQWSSWTTSSRGSCSKTCDGGTRSVLQTRTCTNPRPRGGGRPCSGSPRKSYTERCNPNICIVPGQWSSWTTRSRGSCSKSCDGGTRSVTKTRTCTNPRPRGGGRQCSGSTTKTYTERCNTRICIVNGTWSNWTTVQNGSCSKTCGGGTRSVMKTRTCTNPRPRGGGRPCSGSPNQTDTETCNNHTCPVCKHKLDVVAVLDGSASIGASDFIKLKNAVIKLAQDLNLGSNGQRFGAILFSSKVNETVPLSTNLQSIRSKISNFQKPGEGTATHLGIQSMKQMFQSYGRRGTKQVGIVITDGRSNSESKTISAAEEAHDAGITMIIVGVGPTSELNMYELEAIASIPSDVIHLANFDLLKTKLDSLVQKICNVSGACPMKAVAGQPSFYSENVPGYGWLKKKCDTGKIFDSTNCRCALQTSGPLTGHKTGCQPEVYLPLNTDLKDHSKHQLHIDNSGVTINKAGQALFANNSVLRINRFSDMDFGDTLDISFVLHKVGSSSKDEVVVTNAGYSHTGSIYIIQKSSAIEVRVHNQRGTCSTLSVPLAKAIAKVRLSIHKRVMTVVVNGVSKTTTFEGSIGRVNGALQIGSGTGYASFGGRLEDFKLYLCQP